MKVIAQQLLWKVSVICLVAVVFQASAQQSALMYDASGNTVAIASTGSPSPGIESQPQTQLLQTNSSISFSVVATGAGLSYQWLSNGVPIVGATNDTLYLPSLSGTNGIFSVIISNSSGSVTSSPAVIWADSNGNGIPDWWEMKYFGNLNQKAGGDYDGDGVSNIDEYREGTNPADSISYNPRLYLAESVFGNVAASPYQPYYTNGQYVTLTAIPDAGQGFLGWSGSISGTKPQISLIMNSHKWVGASFGLPLPVALDNSNLVWTTGGSAPWFGQTQVSEDGLGAAQSGTIVGGQQSWLQAVTTNLTQTSRLGFWWNVSSQSPDALSFSIDGTVNTSISGPAVGWQNVVVNLPLGVHTLVWTYTKQSNDYPTGIPFTDAAWLDQVSLVPTNYLPTITAQPQGQGVLPGADVSFSVTAVSALSLAYQWQFNGANLDGATSATLSLTNVQRANTGGYSVVVSTASGSVISSVAILVVGCLEAPSGLVSWWRAEGNALDSTGTNNGTLQGGTVFAPGEVGQALSFDGASGYVAVPTNNVPIGNSPYTIEAWIKPNSMGRNGIIGWGAYGNGNQVNAFRLDPSGLVNYWWGNDLTVTTANLSGGWHHVAATCDGTHRAIYLDGAAIGQDTPTGHNVPYSGNLAIGLTNPGGAEYFNGLIDEISVYSRALAPNEIAAAYYAGAAGKCTSGPVTQLGGILVANGNVVISGSGGPLSGQYYVLTSTNVAFSMSNWARVSTNPFNADGTFSFTNILNPSTPQQFYRIQLP